MEQEKASHELTVFKEFAVASGLTIDSNSIVSCVPPEPDILCTLLSEPHYFELGRILDKHWPPLRIEAVRQAPKLVQVNASKFGLPERDMILSKLKKTYETFGHPVDLVLYYDHDNLLTTGTPPPFDFVQFANDVIMVEVQNRHCVFRRLWVYERLRKCVLWKYAM